ncbi:MAG: flippase-like domain-containing protein [Muribaculum sp.]|nr:flippase-like domain-containing protein [Muribaculum sp.]
MENKRKSASSRLTTIMKYVLPVVLSVGLCYYLYTKIDIEAVKYEFWRCNFWWIGLTLVVATFSHIFRAMRWRIQLDALGINAPLPPLVWSIFGTYAVNLLIPRLGELWRTGYIAKRQDAQFTTVFGSMVCDRLADTVTVLLLTVFTFFVSRSAFIAFAEQYPQIYEGVLNAVNSPWMWGLAVVAVALVVWLFASKTQNKLVIKVRGAVKNLWDGFAVVGTMPHKGRWLLLTCAVWGCYFTQLYLAFFAFSFTENLGIVCALVAFVLSSISMGIPSNGGLGPWHLAIIFALGVYGVGMNQAAAFAMIVWGSQNFFIVLLGLYAFVSIMLDKRKPVKAES